LVAHIPNELVVRGIESVMQSNGKFNHPETCSEVASVDGNRVDDVLTQFLANGGQLIFRELAKILRIV
jgi:hypothetical protein